MIQSIEQRLSIVELVATEILNIQHGFNKDSDELIPLNMKRIADKLNVHETTVSEQPLENIYKRQEEF